MGSTARLPPWPIDVSKRIRTSTLRAAAAFMASTTDGTLYVTKLTRKRSFLARPIRSKSTCSVRRVATIGVVGPVQTNSTEHSLCALLWAKDAPISTPASTSPETPARFQATIIRLIAARVFGAFANRFRFFGLSEADELRSRSAMASTLDPGRRAARSVAALNKASIRVHRRTPHRDFRRLARRVSDRDDGCLARRRFPI